MPDPSPATAPFDPAEIRAVTFDAYGTLFQFHDDEFRVAMGEVLADQGLAHDNHDDLYRAFHSAYMQAAPFEFTRAGADGDGEPDDEQRRANLDRMLNGPVEDWITIREIWRRQWEATFEQNDLAGDAERAAEQFRDRLSVAAPYPDAHETVARLAECDLTLALLSNADDDFLQPALLRSRLRFSLIPSSESLQSYKPHRSIFETLCEMLALEPGQVLYVGDSLPTDVRGAKNAGLRTAWIPRAERQMSDEMPQPDLKLAALADLADLFEARDTEKP